MAERQLEQTGHFAARPTFKAFDPAIEKVRNLKIWAFLNRYGVLILFFALWQIASSRGWLNPAVIPPVDAVVRALFAALVNGVLLGDLLVSLQRAGIAFGAAVVVSIPLGLVMGTYTRFENAIDPVLQMFRQTSALAVYPIFILLMGLGETSKVFVIFWATVFPLLMNTMTGVKQVDRRLIEMASMFGASKLQTFRRVTLPGAIPSIFVGLRLSAGMALLMLVASEMIGANQGLGFKIMQAQYNFQIPLMFGAIVLLAGLGLLSNYSLIFLQRRICKWADPRDIG
ncbi:ABC transporter permease [Paraburkholderia sartisoli]|uniref:Sulfonate transport system permease protein n=1 Tax=Paraburkholderia sartisoli TaxID=83784 RepID=A0A1H4HM12_9BURK|nr:ABC transporter permease [Paraburkholderia sartisoli]SEB22864.1 sulfonate transport system permease protein [Paraburkholderia sartisoli]